MIRAEMPWLLFPFFPNILPHYVILELIYTLIWLGLSHKKYLSKIYSDFLLLVFCFFWSFFCIWYVYMYTHDIRMYLLYIYSNTTFPVLCACTHILFLWITILDLSLPISFGRKNCESLFCVAYIRSSFCWLLRKKYKEGRYIYLLKCYLSSICNI